MAEVRRTRVARAVTTYEIVVSEVEAMAVLEEIGGTAGLGGLWEALYDAMFPEPAIDAPVALIGDPAP